MEIDAIFQEFRRADNARAFTPEGTGLGLSIVKEIVESHGGTIAAASALGKGTTFIIRLPALQANEDCGRSCVDGSGQTSATVCTPFNDNKSSQASISIVVKKIQRMLDKPHAHVYHNLWFGFSGGYAEVCVSVPPACCGVEFLPILRPDV